MSSQQLSPSPEAGQENPPVNAENRKHATKLSTSSPEAIRVASEITANRLANLLIRKGPLAIRLITAQLLVEVPGFDLLSLSKQRRLIMAAMEQGDPENDVVFEKIGWGQWAVRHVNSDYIVTEPNGAIDGNTRMNIHELKEKAKLGWLKKTEPSVEDAPVAKFDARRDSILNTRANLHNIRLPGEKLGSPSHTLSDSEPDSDDDEIAQMRDLKMRYLNGADDNAIDEDSEEDMMDDEGTLFKFEDDENERANAKFKKSPPLKFANRVPAKISPPPALAGSRRKLSSAAVPNSVVKNTSLHSANRHQLFARSRLNSIENLDEYLLSSARNSTTSVPSPTVQNSSVPSTSPLGSWSGKGEFLKQHDLPLSPDHMNAAFQHAGRRKLSFNESSIRLTLSSSLPRGHALAQRPYENAGNVVSASAVSAAIARKVTATQDVASDTDEEDWATMGAETLRSHSVGLSSPAEKIPNEERTAARALVDLMGT